MVRKLGTVAWATLILAIGVTLLFSAIAQYIGVIFQLAGTLALLVGVIAGVTAAVRYIKGRNNNRL